MTKYINSIRNSAKKNYAIAYAGWLLGGELGDSPEYDRKELTYMGAQAVRMNLTELVSK